MDDIIQKKIDRVLDSIQDPQSGMTIAQLGIQIMHGYFYPLTVLPM
jgi:hypothetical protein